MPGIFAQAFQSIPFGNFLTNPIVLAGAVAGKAITAGIAQDFQNTSFEVLLGSEEAAKKMVSDIAKYGMATPYDKMGLGENAKMMLSFGIDDQKIMPTLQAIGDIAMDDANKMNSLTLAFSQMSSTGRLMGQDLLQMVNAEFNPLNEISKTTGKSMEVLKKEMENGKISAKMVETAFMNVTQQGGQFHKMAERMGTTLGGRLAQMMDSVTEKLLKFYNVIEPVVSKLVELGGAAFDAVFNGIGWMFNKIQEGNPIALGLVAVLGAVTTAMLIMKAASQAQAMWTGIVTFANNVQSASWWTLNAAMWANPVTWIVAGVIALIALIGYLIYKVDGWGEAWTHTVNSVTSYWKGFMASLKFGWLTAENFLLSGIDKIKVAWYKLKGLWDKDGAEAGLAEIDKRSEERKAAMEKAGADAAANYLTAMAESEKAKKSLKWNDKGLGDMVGDMKSKLGIADPKQPGMVNSNLGNGGGDKDKTKSNQAIATGGTKHNYITINLKDLIGVLNIKGNDFDDGSQQMADKSSDALLRVLAMASTVGD